MNTGSFFGLRVPLSVLAICLHPFNTAALDEERLWLPVSYQALYLKLRDAAIAAENLNRCVAVLDGTIDLEQSTEDHPIFRIRCRQENGRTYNEMVDGLSIETLTTPKHVDAGPSVEERLLAEEQRRREEAQARLKRMWEMCYDGFLEKSRLMINLQVPEFDGIPSPETLDEDQATFTFDFMAEDIEGQKLEFTASCMARADQSVIVDISRRREPEAEQ